MAAWPATGVHVCALEMESCCASFSFLSPQPFLSLHYCAINSEFSLQRINSGVEKRARATAFKGGSVVHGGTKAKQEMREWLMKGGGQQ